MILEGTRLVIASLEPVLALPRQTSPFRRRAGIVPLATLSGSPHLPQKSNVGSINREQAKRTRRRGTSSHALLPTLQKINVSCSISPRWPRIDFLSVGNRLGNALFEALDELIQSGHINPQLAMKVLNQVSLRWWDERARMRTNEASANERAGVAL